MIDPESGLDDVRNVGIRGGRIVAITTDPVVARDAIDVRGLVVAPGFIDLHAHGQEPKSAWLQARDGVTTALEDLPVAMTAWSDDITGTDLPEPVVVVLASDQATMDQVVEAVGLS